MFADSVPSRTELARFELTIEAEWAVTDPVAIVRRGIVDGAAIVRSRLLDVARTVCHRFEIDRIAEVEAALADQLRAEPRAYEEGIGVRRCYVRVVPDERTRRRQERFEDARVERQLTTEEVDDLRGSIRTSSDLFLRYLAQDPNRVGGLIADMRQHEQLKEERVIELFNKAVEEKVIRYPGQRDAGPAARPDDGVLQPEGRTDLFGTRDLPVAPPEPRAIAGRSPGSRAGRASRTRTRTSRPSSCAGVPRTGWTAGGRCRGTPEPPRPPPSAPADPPGFAGMDFPRPGGAGPGSPGCRGGCRTSPPSPVSPPTRSPSGR